jgi:transposase
MGSKVIQETIKYFGVAHNEEQRQVLLKLAQDELNSLKSQIKPSSLSPIEDSCNGALLSSMTEHYRMKDGFHDILGALFDELNLSSYFTKLRYGQLKDVTIARIADPSSKLRTSQILTDQFLKPFSENRIYRLMDDLIEQEDSIKKAIFEKTKKLTHNQAIDLLFFDVTTLYFESQKADDLRNFGYGKDGKKGEVQILLALATTSNGLPIGYTLFPGNTGEVDTLLESLNDWKKIFTIGEVTIVADRAMMSEDNLKKMEEAQLNFVVAAKLKSLPEKLKSEILSRKHEISIEVDKEAMKVQEHQYKGRRLVVSYNESRARKDKGDRERLIAKLKSKLGKNNQTNPKKLITNNGYLKFVNEQREGKLILNEDKIIQDELWDGLHGIITSKREAPAQELLQDYRRLWIIEESFRINKHSLSMRPIYHFRTKRIKAHILICYLAFAIARITQERIKIFDESISVEKIREELSEIEISILEDKISGKFYQLPSKMSQKAKLIYRAIGAKRCDRPCEFKMNKNVVEQKKFK